MNWKFEIFKSYYISEPICVLKVYLSGYIYIYTACPLGHYWLWWRVVCSVPRYLYWNKCWFVKDPLDIQAEFLSAMFSTRKCAIQITTIVLSSALGSDSLFALIFIFSFSLLIAMGLAIQRLLALKTEQSLKCNLTAQFQHSLSFVPRKWNHHIFNNVYIWNENLRYIHVCIQHGNCSENYDPPFLLWNDMPICPHFQS